MTPTERVSHIVRLFTLSGMAAPRIQIQDVRPQVDCGRYRAKACRGDPVPVAATIFRDGYEKIRATVRYRQAGTRRWREQPLEAQGNDQFAAVITPDALGPWEFRIQAWVDPYASWLDEHDRKLAAGQADLSGELSEGRLLFGEGGVEEWHGAAERLSDRNRTDLVTSPVLGVDVERERARFGAWYELFPRSWGGFRGVADGAAGDRRARLRRRLPAAGAPDRRDVPQGTQQHRGARRRATPAARGRSAGSPAVTTRCTRTSAARTTSTAMVAAARAAGIEIALDFAIQCSPDHPWLQEHPEWFNRRPDGTIKYAENPPKRYQDIHNVDWDSDERDELWQALLDVVLGWCERGVLAFRVDNPHTKPMPFWEWLIAEVRRRHPEAIFLSEAFTRPAPMTTLAKIGFSQSYTYFTWKNTKAELVEFAEQVRSWSAFYRPNMWPNTPDILHEYLQEGGRPAFEARLVLAATLSPSYGIYSGYEALREHPGPQGQRGVRRLREVRGQAALAAGAAAAADPPPERDPAGPSRTTAVREPHLARYAQRGARLRTRSGRARMSSSPWSTSIPLHVQEGLCIVPPALGLPDGFIAVDLLSDTAYRWRTGRNYVGLPPGGAHVITVAPRGRGRRRPREWARPGRRDAGQREPARAPRAGRAPRARRRQALVRRRPAARRRARRSPPSSTSDDELELGLVEVRFADGEPGTYLVALGRGGGEALEDLPALARLLALAGVDSPCATSVPRGPTSRTRRSSSTRASC